MKKGNNPSILIKTYLKSATPWQVRMVRLISEIPSGYLASYGALAERAGNRYGARSAGTLRKQLYGLLGHETTFPLHRVCGQGDVLSLRDSEETRTINNRLRKKEGSLDKPQWF